MLSRLLGRSHSRQEKGKAMTPTNSSDQQGGEGKRLKVLVACEFSGVVRRAFRALGHDAWSCDLLPTEDGSLFHLQCDVEGIMRGAPPWNEPWDLMIAHPPCTRLANSGVRWLHGPPLRQTKAEMWQELENAARFYITLRNAPILRKAIENPVMHRHALERIGSVPRQVVQPWWFGDRTFKATGFELHNLPPLVPTNRLTPPKPGTPEHKEWSWVHRASPGPDRWKIRSRTAQGIAKAMAEQWGGTTRPTPCEG